MSASTMTVGEVREALKGFDETDRVIGIFPEYQTQTEDGDVKTHPGKGWIHSVAKHGCRTVAIKVSDE